MHIGKNLNLAILFLFVVALGFFLPKKYSFAADMTWTGTTSTDWATGTNWSTGTIPTSADNVIIPDTSTTANDPAISAGAVCYNLTISASGILNGNAQTITVYGNWTNNGVFNHGNGKVEFYGWTTGPFTFTPGSSSYYDLELDKLDDNGNHNDLSISGTVLLEGNLTQTTGDLVYGQINLSGNYIIGATSYGSPEYGTPTTVNFSGTGDQSVIYTSGGQGATIRVDKPAGSLIISDNIIIRGWNYISGNVTGLDTHRLIFGDCGLGSFTPGSLVYSTIELNKPVNGNDYDTVVIYGTANVSGDFLHTSGMMRNGQINLSGNYTIGANANGGQANYGETYVPVINFNNTVDQSIIYNGGIGLHVRVNKAGGSLIISNDIKVSGWTYSQGTVTGISNHVLTLSGPFWDTFTPGSLTYGGLVVNKNNHNGSWDEVRMGSGTLNISGNLTVTEGKFILSTNNPTVNVSGNVAIASAGIFYAGTNPITVNGNWTNSGTFNHGNGKVVFKGTGPTTFSPGSSNYYNLELNRTDGYGNHDDLYFSGTATILKDFIHTDGEIGQGQLNISGNYIIGANANGDANNGARTVINLNGTTDQAVVYNNGGTGGQIRVDKTGGTLTIGSDIIIMGWTYVQGTVAGLDTHKLLFGDYGQGYFTGGSLIYSDIELNKSTTNNSNDTLTILDTVAVSGNFTHTSGQLIGGQVNLAGDYILGANAGGAGADYTYAPTVINLNSTSDQALITSGGYGAHIRIDKASGNFTISDDIKVSGWTYVRGAVVGLSNHTLTLGDNIRGSFVFGNLTYGNIEINKTHHGNWDEATAGSGTLNINGYLKVTEGKFILNTNNTTLNISGDVTVSTGAIFTAGTNPITVNGNWTNAGTFNHGNGTVVFGGTDNGTFTPGSSTYYKLQIDKTTSNYSYNRLYVTDAVTLSGNLIHTDGRMVGGQINVSGDYMIGSLANASYGSDAVTTINMNHPTANQSIMYSAGGIGSNVRIDKAGGTLTISSDIVVNGWTYIGGTVFGTDSYMISFRDWGNSVFVPGNLSYKDITVDKISSSANYNKLMTTGTATLSGNLYHTNGRLSGGQIDLAGNYIISASADGSFGSDIVTVVNLNNGLSDQEIICTDGGIGGHVRIDKAGASVIISGNVSVDDWTYVQGTVSGIEEHTLIFSGWGSGSFTPGSLVYGNITVNKNYDSDSYDNLTVSSGTLTLTGNLTLTDGELILNTNNPSINLSGNLAIGSASTFTKGTNPITFNGTIPSTFTDNSATPQNIGKVIVNKTNADMSQNTLTLASNLVCDTMTVSADNTLDLEDGSYTLNIANAGAIPDVLTISGTLESGDGTIKLSATNSAGSINLPAAAYGNLELSGSETYILTNNTVISGNLTINSTSNLDTDTYDINLTGNLTNSGTFNPNTNTITLNGSNQSLSGNTTFYNLTKTITSSDTLAFQASSTTTITNHLTFKGSNRDNRLSLLSATTDTPWNLTLNEAATYDMDYLNVQDSTANRTLTVINSLDAGNNINWQITNNTAPTITVPVITIDGQIATVSVTIQDIDQDNVSIKVEYSQDNGATWHDPYLLSATSDLNNADIYQITDIPTLTDNHLIFTWDTKDERNELGSVMLSDTLKIRITPYDNSDLGSTQTSESFSVNNHSTAFIPPIKPDLSNLTITNRNNILTFTNLPSNITQIAVSQTEDFSNSSFQDITLPIPITSTLYLKFRTHQGATSDTIIYNPTSQNTNTLIQEGDIVKTDSSFDVYIIKLKNNKQYKRLILSPNVFNSYRHLKWGNIKTISEEQLNQYQTSDLVKVQNDNNIYKLTSNGDQGERKIIAIYDSGILNQTDNNTTIDIDSIYEINEVDRESYALTR